MHDQLFASLAALEMIDLARYATGLNLDLIKFQECMDAGKYANEIRKDISEGQKAGVRGTPDFFVGVYEREDTKIKVLKVIRGAQPYQNFKEALDRIPA